MSVDTQNECTRCGTCCAKGGPALHKEDLPLLERASIDRKDLLTLRKGELVRNDISGQLEPLDQEIIKLRGRSDDTWTCCFLNVIDRLCFIYNDRPVECRKLDCRNTSKIEAMYDKDRITRKDIVGKNNGLAEMIDVHEQQCDYKTLATYAAQIEEEASREKFLEAVRFDMAFRSVVKEKTGIPANELPFFFGRPVAETACMFGLTVTFTEHGPEVSRTEHQSAA